MCVCARTHVCVYVHIVNYKLFFDKGIFKKNLSIEKIPSSVSKCFKLRCNIIYKIYTAVATPFLQSVLPSTSSSHYCIPASTLSFLILSIFCFSCIPATMCYFFPCNYSISCTAVSYTHLDVYKRQVNSSAATVNSVANNKYTFSL